MLGVSPAEFAFYNADSIIESFKMKPHPYCKKSNNSQHSFVDMSYWNNENHPTCEYCKIVDRSRDLTTS